MSIIDILPTAPAVLALLNIAVSINANIMIEVPNSTIRTRIIK